MSPPVRPQFESTSAPVVLPWLRLIRLPNVFTVLSNVAMGFLFVHDVNTLRAHWLPLCLLLAASTALYWAGMIWNDVFDFEVDREERPFRPLPSGQISLTSARTAGAFLLVMGILCGSAAGWSQIENQAPAWLSIALSLALATAIMAYNRVLKATWLGPLAMGLCRTLNVLLAMSTPAMMSEEPTTSWLFSPAQWLVAGGVGVYVFGLTWFARQETETAHRSGLLLGMVAMIGGVAMLALLPQFRSSTVTFIRLQPHMAVTLFALLGFPILRRALGCLMTPEPAAIQATVKTAILSLIIFDAVVTVMVAGPTAGLVVALLLVPSLWLGRWIYST